MYWLIITFLLSIYILYKPDRGILITTALIPLINYEYPLSFLRIPISIEKIIIPVIVLGFIEHSARQFFKKTPSPLFIIIFLLYAFIYLLSVIINNSNPNGYFYFIETLTYILFFFAMLDFFQERNSTNISITFIRTFILAGFMVSIIGFLQYYLRTDFLYDSKTVNGYLVYGTFGKGRVSSTIGHPNFLAAFLVAVIPITFVETFLVKQISQRTFFIVALLADIICLYLSFSKIALLVLFLIFVSFIFMSKTRRVIFVLIPLIILFIFGYVHTKDYDFYRSRLSMIKRISLDYRLIIYKVELKLMRGHLLFGRGGGSLEGLVRNYFRDNSDSFTKLDIENLVKKMDVHSAHSSYMRILFETGIIGLLTYLIAIGSCYWSAVGHASSKITYRKYALMLGITAILLTSFTDEILSFSKIQFIFWIFFAIAIVSPLPDDDIPIYSLT